MTDSVATSLLSPSWRPSPSRAAGSPHRSLTISLSQAAPADAPSSTIVAPDGAGAPRGDADDEYEATGWLNGAPFETSRGFPVCDRVLAHYTQLLFHAIPLSSLRTLLAVAEARAASAEAVAEADALARPAPKK